MGGRGGTHLVSLWTHLVSLGFNWTHLNSLIWIHMDSLGLTWTHLDSLGLTWTHLDSLGFTWTHLDSLGLTSHLDSFWSHCNPTKEKGKPPTAKREKGKGRHPHLSPNSTRQADRAHARTPRTARHETISRLCSSLQPPIYNVGAGGRLLQ